MVRLISIIILLLILSQSQLHGQNSGYRVLVIRNDYTNTPYLILNDVLSLGYTAELKNAVDINEEDLNGYNAIIFSCGRNLIPYLSDLARWLVSYSVDRKGGIIIEGGNVASCAEENRYRSFMEKALKIIRWENNGGGNLLMNPEYINSPLVNYPNEISGAPGIDYEFESDQDVVTTIAPVQLLFYPQNNPGKAGILAYPNETIGNPWAVNMFFNYAALTDRTNAKNMLENFLYHVIQNTVSINPISQNIPANFKLHQNFPNPFNPDTKIRFDVPKSSPVRLEIFDAAGRLIDIPLDRFMQPGEYELIFPGNKNIDLSSGIYFYMIKADGIVDCKKMILLR